MFSTFLWTCTPPPLTPVNVDLHPTPPTPQGGGRGVGPWGIGRLRPIFFFTSESSANFMHELCAHPVSAQREECNARSAVRGAQREERSARNAA